MAFRSVFDRKFKYRSADSTDVRLTFDRIRREQRLLEQRAAQRQAAAAPVVVTMVPRVKESNGS